MGSRAFQQKAHSALEASKPTTQKAATCLSCPRGRGRSDTSPKTGAAPFIHGEDVRAALNLHSCKSLYLKTSVDNLARLLHLCVYLPLYQCREP